MILPPAATAASGADPSNPSLDQYVESVPSSHGDKTPPSGGSSSLGGDLRRQIQAQGGSDAKQLEAVAGSPAYGAPPASHAAKGSGTKRGGSGDARKSSPRPSALDSATAAAVGGSGSTTTLLVAGLALITALAVSAALWSRRSAAGLPK
jgi:hypothetical protein